MTDLSRSLLAAARDGLAPDAATTARVRARVASAVAPAAAGTAATAGTTGTAGTAGTAAASSAASSALLKLAAFAVVAGVVMTGFVVGRGSRADAPTLSLRMYDTDEPTARIAPMASRESALPRARHRIAGPGPASDGTNSANEATDALEPASLGREVELIDNAMASLRSGSPSRALATLVTFDRETLGHAQLAEDAAAIELEARCALREDVSAKLAAFDTKWPRSAQRARISAACR
jgi:hypothetical protein